MILPLPSPLLLQASCYFMINNNCIFLQITQDTTSVLLEVTSSTSLNKAKEVADTLLLAVLQSGLSSKNTKGGEAAVVVQQVRVEDENGGLRVLYPSHTDLAFQQEKIRVVMPVK